MRTKAWDRSWEIPGLSNKQPIDKRHSGSTLHTLELYRHWQYTAHTGTLQTLAVRCTHRNFTDTAHTGTLQTLAVHFTHRNFTDTGSTLHTWTISQQQCNGVAYFNWSPPKKVTPRMNPKTGIFEILFLNAALWFRSNHETGTRRSITVGPSINQQINNSPCRSTLTSFTRPAWLKTLAWSRPQLSEDTT